MSRNNKAQILLECLLLSALLVSLMIVFDGLIALQKSRRAQKSFFTENEAAFETSK